MKSHDFSCKNRKNRFLMKNGMPLSQKMIKNSKKKIGGGCIILPRYFNRIFHFDQYQNFKQFFATQRIHFISPLLLRRRIKNIDFDFCSFFSKATFHFYRYFAFFIFFQNPSSKILIFLSSKLFSKFLSHHIRLNFNSFPKIFNLCHFVNKMIKIH